MLGKFQSVVLSSGIEVLVKAMPSKLWTKVNRSALIKYPDPEIPTKTLKTVNDEETVPNPKDKKYLEKKAVAESNRGKILGDLIVDICVSLMLTKEHEKIIKKLERFLDKFPSDKEERAKEFLYLYALADEGDFTLVYTLAQEQMLVSEQEVKDRINSFRGQMAWSGHTDPTTSRVNGEQQLELQPES